MIISISINTAKIDKNRLYQGRNGKYLNITLFENESPDQFGNHFMAKQSLSKEERQSGVKAEIIGNGKIVSGNKPKPGNAKSQPESDEPPF